MFRRSRFLRYSSSSALRNHNSLKAASIIFLNFHDMTGAATIQNAIRDNETATEVAISLTSARQDKNNQQQKGGNKKVYDLLDQVIDWSFLPSIPSTVTTLNLSSENNFCPIVDASKINILEQNYAKLLSQLCSSSGSGFNSLRVEHLTIQGAGKCFNDDMLKEFLKCLPNLKSLSVGFAPALTEKSIDIITSSPSADKLLSLSLTNNTSISPNAPRMDKIVEAVNAFYNADRGTESENNTQETKLAKALSHLIDESVAEKIASKCSKTLRRFSFEGIAPISQNITAFGGMKELSVLKIETPFLYFPSSKMTSSKNKNNNNNMNDNNSFPKLVSLTLADPLLPKNCYEALIEMKKRRFDLTKDNKPTDSNDSPPLIRHDKFISALSLFGRDTHVEQFGSERTYRRILASTNKSSSSSSTASDKKNTDDKANAKFEYGKAMPNEVYFAIPESRFEYLRPFLPKKDETSADAKLRHIVGTSFSKLSLTNFEADDADEANKILKRWFDRKEAMIKNVIPNADRAVVSNQEENSVDGTGDEFYRQLEDQINTTNNQEKNQQPEIKNTPFHISETLTDLTIASRAANAKILTVAVGDNLRNLRRLEMTSTNTVAPSILMRDSVAERMGNNLPRLKRLKLSGCFGFLTNAGGLMNFSTQRMPFLSAIDLDRTRLINGDLVDIPGESGKINMESITMAEKFTFKNNNNFQGSNQRRKNKKKGKKSKRWKRKQRSKQKNKHRGKNVITQARQVPEEYEWDMISEANN